jgi:hypothetical protein
MPDQDPSRRGATLGTAAGATLGTAAGAPLGPQRADRYRARITTPDGRRADIQAIETADIEFAHTDVSDVRLTVPRVEGLAGFRFGNLDVYYGDRLIFQATLERFPGPGTDARAELYGRGPGRVLKRQTLSVSYENLAAWEAIEQVWDRTRFDATVFEPASPTTLTAFEAEGTALEVLQDLHERAGMRFTIQHTQPGYVVESYVPSEVTRSLSVTAINYDSEGDVTEYANEVRVFGGLNDSNVRVSATASDDSEIDANGLQPIRIDDASITTTADAQARADTELATRLDKDSFSGSVEFVPEIVLPGYQRSVPEFDTGDGPPTISHDRTTLTEGPGEATATAEFNARDGIADVLADQQRRLVQLSQPDDAASGSGTDPDPTPTIIDSWEGGDLADYPEVNDGFDVVTGDSGGAFDGTAYLQQPGPEDGLSYIASAPGDGLSNYFPKGTEARLLFWSEDTDSAKRKMLFGVPDPADADNCYVAEFYRDRGGTDRVLRLRERSGGSESPLGATTIGTSDLADKTWYSLRVTWDDGTLGGSDNDITVTLVQAPAGSATTLATVGPINDATYAGNEGVGVWANNPDNVETRFDYYHIPP